MSDKWDLRFMNLAAEVAGWSSDPRTKVGAVLVGSEKQVLSTGYNGFPRGIAYTRARLRKPLKLQLVCHAERNALDNCACTGTKTKGGILYTTLVSCNECAKSIIQCRINEVVILDHIKYYNTEWMKNIQLTYQLFDEAKIYYRFMKVKSLSHKVLIDGVLH